MNKFFIFGLISICSFAFISCSEDEEILEPSGVADNKFAVPSDATGPEAELRRDFFAQTGVYMMFDDLLSREYKGLDKDGNEIWAEERIDFAYDLTDYGLNPPKFVMLESQEEKERAASLIKTYVLPHIEGGALTPFSFLAVKSLERYRTSYPYEYEDAYTVSCWRCLAIATGEWAEAEGEERDAITATILKDLLSSKISYTSEAAKPFTEISYEYSGMYLDEIYDDWDDNKDISRVYELGFLSHRSGYYGDWLPYTSDDFNAYFDLVLSMDESEVMEKYGEYAMIVTKYNLIKDALESLGYKF